MSKKTTSVVGELMSYVTFYGCLGVVVFFLLAFGLGMLATKLFW